jgi:bHLH factor
VQYIHHLKENEARNIEKWTLEKLLMDQAMGDLQAQLEEVKRMWEEERMARSRLEADMEVFKNMNASAGASKEESSAVGKKRSAEGQDVGAEIGADLEKNGKRPRVD